MTLGPYLRDGPMELVRVAPPVSEMTLSQIEHAGYTYLSVRRGQGPPLLMRLTEGSTLAERLPLVLTNTLSGDRGLWMVRFDVEQFSQQEAQTLTAYLGV